jgi:hypothetical protein
MKKSLITPFLTLLLVLTSSSLFSQKFYPSVDTYIQQNTPTEKKDTLQGYKLECRMSGALSRVSFIEFDLGSLSTPCDKAEVNLFCYETANLGDEDVEIYEVTSGNFDGNTTWENFNANYTFGSTALDKKMVMNATDPLFAAWYKFDITSLVNRVIATSGTNKKVKVGLKAVTGNIVVRFYAVNVKTDPDWDFAKDFAPYLDVQTTSGVNEVSENQIASVFMNSNNQLTVACKNELSRDASVVIYTFSGQKVAEKQITNLITSITTDFAQGVYLVKVTNAGKNTTQKIVIE